MLFQRSQHPHGGSQPSASPVPRDPTPLSGLCRHAKEEYRQNIHTEKTANQRQLDGNTFFSKSSMAPTAFALLQPVSPSMGEIPTGAPATHPIVTATSCGSWNLPSLFLPWSLYPLGIPLNGEPLPESKLQQKCHPHTDNFSDGSVETAVPRPQK